MLPTPFSVQRRNTCLTPNWLSSSQKAQLDLESEALDKTCDEAPVPKPQNTQAQTVAITWLSDDGNKVCKNQKASFNTGSNTNFDSNVNILNISKMPVAQLYQ